MQEHRHIIAAVIGAIALVGAIILAALERDPVQIATLTGIATTFGGYAIGLQSQPYTGEDA